MITSSTSRGFTTKRDESNGRFRTTVCEASAGSKAVRGFTLIELLVVVTIIGLLSSIVVASLTSARVKGENAARVSTVHSITTALAIYFSANGDYPALLHNNCGGTDGTVAGTPFMETLVSNKYLASYPTDPSRVNCGIQYVRDSALSYRVFWAQTGMVAPATGCNQAPTWFCVQP